MLDLFRGMSSSNSELKLERSQCCKTALDTRGRRLPHMLSNRTG
jgi:hypothetical protein